MRANCLIDFFEKIKTLAQFKNQTSFWAIHFSSIMPRGASVVTAILAEVEPHKARMKSARDTLQKSVDGAKARTKHIWVHRFRLPK